MDWLAADAPAEGASSFALQYPVKLRDGSRLLLPLRPLPGGEMAIALLMSNQTSFRIERLLAARLTAVARAAGPEAIVGIPTLGLPYARSVAEALGLPDYVALGHSRKFWYDDALSETAISSTSPDQAKQLYLDPALLARVQGRRVVVVDDVLNSGNTMAAAIRLLRRVHADVAVIAAVLTEGWEWHGTLAAIDADLPANTRALGHIPLFGRSPAGWVPLPETELSARPKGYSSGLAHE